MTNNMDDKDIDSCVKRLDALELGIDRLRATIAQMNKHLGMVTIKANDGSRLSSLISRSFEFALIDIQELRRDVDSAMKDANDDC